MYDPSRPVVPRGSPSHAPFACASAVAGSLGELWAQLETSLGRVLHTGDWKLDPAPLVGPLTDEQAFRSLTQQGRDLTLRTGAGIVADSIADEELEETRIKARGVLRSFVDADGHAYG